MEEEIPVYFSCIGWPASGKSAFQSLLLRTIYQGRDFHLKVAPKSSCAEQAAYEELRRTWTKNELPWATAVHQFSEFRLLLSSIKGSEPNISCTAIDVSGEDLAEIVPGFNKRLRLDDDVAESRPYCLNRLSLEEGVRLFIFAFVDPRRDDNDVLIEHVAGFLLENIPVSIIKDSVLSIVLTRSEIAISRLPRNRRVYYQENPMDSELCDEYIERYEPAALKTLRTWAGNQQTFTLDIDTSCKPGAKWADTYRFPNKSIEGIWQIMYEHIVRKTDRINSETPSLFDSVELKPGIFGFRIDLKKLYQIVKGRS